MVYLFRLVPKFGFGAGILFASFIIASSRRFADVENFPRDSGVILFIWVNARAACSKPLRRWACRLANYFFFRGIKRITQYTNKLLIVFEILPGCLLAEKWSGVPSVLMPVAPVLVFSLLVSANVYHIECRTIL